MTNTSPRPSQKYKQKYKPFTEAFRLVKNLKTKILQNNVWPRIWVSDISPGNNSTLDPDNKPGDGNVHDDGDNREGTGSGGVTETEGGGGHVDTGGGRGHREAGGGGGHREAGGGCELIEADGGVDIERQTVEVDTERQELEKD